jgi:hypothetical protein
MSYVNRKSIVFKSSVLANVRRYLTFVLSRLSGPASGRLDVGLLRSLGCPIPSSSDAWRGAEVTSDALWTLGRTSPQQRRKEEPMGDPQKPPTKELLEEWLKPTATTSERVRALLAIGLQPADLSRSTGLTVSAVRNWSMGQAEPRPDAAITLDDLRAVAKILLDGEMEPQRVAYWVRGWNPRIDGRPLDVVAEKPMEVRAAAHGEVLDREPAGVS